GPDGPGELLTGRRLAGLAGVRLADRRGAARGRRRRVPDAAVERPRRPLCRGRGASGRRGDRRGPAPGLRSGAWRPGIAGGPVTETGAEMTCIKLIGTYLPPWQEGGRRLPGGDEDAGTMAVEAGRVLLERAPGGGIERVVLVTRDLPLLEGGNGATLLAGLGLPSDLEVVERLGGAPAMLDAVLSARPRTLVLGADLDPAGAGAVLVSADGTRLRPVSRIARSLPVTARSRDGVMHDYDDPRLLRERGLKASLRQAGPEDKPFAVAGIPHGQMRGMCAGDPPRLPT